MLSGYLCNQTVCFRRLWDHGTLVRHPHGSACLLTTTNVYCNNIQPVFFLFIHCSVQRYNTEQKADWNWSWLKHKLFNIVARVRKFVVTRVGQRGRNHGCFVACPTVKTDASGSYIEHEYNLSGVSCRFLHKRHILLVGKRTS